MLAKQGSSDSNSNCDKIEMESTTFDARMAVRNPDLIQLYSIATPNGIKVAACLEELVTLKQEDFEFNYEPHSIDIRHAENRTEAFANINPNQKIPDPHGPDGRQVTDFESGAILLYLAEKFGELIPIDPVQRMEVMKWLFWGSASFTPQVKLFGFYFKYCPHALPYCVERYTKEVKRLLQVLNKQLSHTKPYIAGDLYSIADICVWPWVYALHENYDNAAENVFDGFGDLVFVKEWYQRCINRPASKKSLEVCSFVFPSS